MSDPNYSVYGPVGICDLMQEEYGRLVQDKDWPALAEEIPQSNNAAASPGNSIVTTTRDGPHRNGNGRRCYKCGSEFHLANTCDEENTSGGGTNNPNNNTTNVWNVPPRQSSNKWKYIHPADENAIVEIDGVEWKFCNHCRCRRTQKAGFFNKTHTSRDHQFGNRSTGNSNASNPSSGAEATAPGASLSPADDPDPVPTPIKREPSGDEVDTDPNGLVFEGAYLAPFDDDGAWMAGVQESEEDIEEQWVSVGVSTIDLPRATPSTSVNHNEDDPLITTTTVFTTLARREQEGRDPSWAPNVLAQVGGWVKYDDNFIYVGDAPPGPHHCHFCGTLGPFRMNALHAHLEESMTL